MDRAVIKWLLYRDILLMVVHYDLYSLEELGGLATGNGGLPKQVAKVYGGASLTIRTEGATTYKISLVYVRVLTRIQPGIGLQCERPQPGL